MTRRGKRGQYIRHVCRKTPFLARDHVFLRGGDAADDRHPRGGRDGGAGAEGLPHRAMVRESKEATPNVIKRAPASAVSHGRRVAGGRWARRGCALAKLLKPGTKAFRPVFLIRENAVDNKNLLSCDFAAFINAALSWKPPNRHFHHCKRKPREIGRASCRERV